MPTILLCPASTSVGEVLSDRYRHDGWTVTSDPDDVIDAAVYDPGLFDGAPRLDAVADLLARVATWRLRPRDDGGASIVVVGSREQLGMPDHADVSAVAGGLASAVRSLALRLAPDNVTVNLIAAASPAYLTVPGLLPDPVTAHDVGATARFLLDPRSRYITGQVLFCCAGASLLSSLSV